MASKWQSKENQMLKAFTMLGAPPQFNLSPMIFPALRARNDGVWQDNLHIGIINAKFQCHPSQGHCIWMSLIRLYNTKGYFSEYKMSGSCEKLVGEVFLEYGEVLTPFKSRHLQDARWMNFLSSRGSPSSEVLIDALARGLSTDRGASFQSFMVGPVLCFDLPLVHQTCVGSPRALSQHKFASVFCHIQWYQISDHEKEQPSIWNLGPVASSKG